MRYPLYATTLLVAACFNPTFRDPTCGPNGECPSGTVCVSGTCRANETPRDDANVDGPIDGPPDAPAQPVGFTRLLDVVDSNVTGGPHANFPLLVALSGTWLRSQSNGGDVVRDDGADLYFSADVQGAIRLDHEVESYVASTGTLLAWVRISSLTAQTQFYVHYGDPSITTSQQNVTGVWNSSYELVAHMQSGPTDSTAKNIASPSGVSTVAGRIGNGMLFNGGSSVIDYGSAPAVDNVFAAGGSVEVWIRPTTYGENGLGRVFSKFTSVGWTLNVNQTDQAISFLHSSTTSAVWESPINSVNPGTWRHVVLVYDKDSGGNNPSMYLDGVPVVVDPVDPPSGTLANDSSAPLLIGNSVAQDRTFDGVIDEVRVSSAPVASARVATEYANESNPTAFVTVGAPL